MREVNSTIVRKFQTRNLIVLFTIGLITGWLNVNAQTLKEDESESFTPLLSKLALVSVHVRSSSVHDSIFHLLTDKLGLSVEYYPETVGDRRYTCVYAGNMYIEPCGPFSNFNYDSRTFKAIFFGFNWDSDRSISSLVSGFNEKNIKTRQGDMIEVTDTSLVKSSIYFVIASRAKPSRLDDSLRTVMLENNKTGLGIEKIKEVRVGYKDNDGLKKWMDLIKPSVLSKDGLWKPIEGPSIRFVKSNIREVNAIVFKVQSLKKAKTYLIGNNLLGTIYKDEIGLDKSKTFGLSIFLSE
jgi:hypothetical protein